MHRITGAIDEINSEAGLSKAQKIERLLTSDAFTYDRDAFLKRLEQEDIYGRRFARYMLYKLDILYGGGQVRLQTPAVLSIEHVLPQNPAPDSVWYDDFDEEDLEQWVDKLGNLVLISRRKNSSQGRLGFEDKKNRYFNRNIETFPNSVRVMQKRRWDLAALQVNHQEVIQKLREYC